MRRQHRVDLRPDPPEVSLVQRTPGVCDALAGGLEPTGLVERGSGREVPRPHHPGYVVRAIQRGGVRVDTAHVAGQCVGELFDRVQRLARVAVAEPRLRGACSLDRPRRRFDVPHEDQRKVRRVQRQGLSAGRAAGTGRADRLDSETGIERGALDVTDSAQARGGGQQMQEGAIAGLLEHRSSAGQRLHPLDVPITSSQIDQRDQHVEVHRSDEPLPRLPGRRVTESDDEVPSSVVEGRLKQRPHQGGVRVLLHQAHSIGQPVALDEALRQPAADRVHERPVVTISDQAPESPRDGLHDVPRQTFWRLAPQESGGLRPVQ